MIEKDLWEPLSAATARMFANWEAEHRVAFERQCRDDGVPKTPKADDNRKGEAA